MKNMALTRFKDQRGVAMITVLLVGAVMTATASVAALSTIKEFRASTDDRKASLALSYAEAGLDRTLQYIRGQNFGVLLKAGCEKPAMTVPTGKVVTGTGQFDAWLKVFNPAGTTPATRYSDGTPFAASPNPAANAACVARKFSPKVANFFVIHSTGTAPSAKRVVEQVIKVTASGLPIGLYANSIDANGTPNVYNVSMVSETSIVGREKLLFQGCDPYYTLEDFWPGTTWPGGMTCGAQAPSAAHAVTGIKLNQNGSNPEFTGGAGTLNCSANGGGNTLIGTQSLWDGDGSAGSGTFAGGCTPWVGTPGTSKFTDADRVRVTPKPQLSSEDYDALKQLAQDSGIYCSIGSTTSCTKGGSSYSYQTVWQDGDIASLFAAGTLNFVAFYDFTTGTPTSNDVKWKADVWPCSLTSPETTRTAIIIVRNGGISIENGADINGALIFDGDFKYNGTVTINGTVISKGKITAGGGVTFSLDQCFVQNMPFALGLQAQPLHWSEIDR